MLKSIGFVPIVDTIAAETPNLYPAYIYGYMWVARTSDNQFGEPLDNIPERINASRTTVRKWVKWLCDNQYLIDLTPDLDNQPHTYQLTDKAELNVTVTVEIAPFAARTAAVRQTNGAPFAGRTAVGLKRRSPDEPHDHDMMHDHDNELRTAISAVNELWQAIGFDLRGLPKMLKTWAGHEGGLIVCLEAWLDALNGDAVPESWGAGLVYKKIAAGEMPPDKPRTIGDEVRELMELQNGGEIE